MEKPLFKEWDIRGVEPNVRKLYNMKYLTIFGIEENIVVSFENRSYAALWDINKI